jgi:hypothetical protein
MNIFQRLVNKVSDTLAGLDDTVRENIPGGWTLPALLAGGYYFAPEIGAFFNPASGATVAAAEVAGGEAAVNAALTSGELAGTAGAIDSSLAGGGFTGTNALAGAEGLTAMPTNYLAPGAGGDLASSAFPLTGGAGLPVGAESTGLASFLPSGISPTTALIAGSSALGALGSIAGARAMSNANQSIADSNYRIFQEQKALQEPWRKAGEEALNKLLPLSMNYTPFGMDKFTQDPGYAFRLSEGMKALDRTAAARGGLLSGATLKGAQRFNQDLASQEYQNAFNRYNTDYNMRLGPLQTLAGYGQGATNNLAGATNAYGANQAETLANRGNINASSYLNATDALTRGASQYLRNESDNALIAALRRP